MNKAMTKGKALRLLLPGLCMVMAACQESFDERLVREAHDQSRINCPRKVDKFTILDSITYSPDTREWAYCYTLTDSLDCEAFYTDDVREGFHETLLASVKNNLDIRRLKERGIVFVYSYRLQSNGHEIIREVFTKDDY